MSIVVDGIELAESTPVLIGAGQFVERTSTQSSPMQLASRAALSALEHASGQAAPINRNHSSNQAFDQLVASIDTIAVTRLFADSGELFRCNWGGSHNPPQSVASAIGAKPKDRIYSQVGGNQPQSLLIEFARDIAKGERELVLLCGGEAIKNQRSAERDNQQLYWVQHFAEALDDRGYGEPLGTDQEFKNGLNNAAMFYALIEQGQRNKLGRGVKEHQQAMADLISSFSPIAANNPFAQFSGQQTVGDILRSSAINHLYTKRMIAQVSVNQAAAVLLCSLGKAKELGIPQRHYIFLHAMAQGSEPHLSKRPDLSMSPVANRVTDRVLEMAELNVDDIDLFDLYSCFPCAITAIADHLNLPTDGSKQLTMTGGLPCFGGPGNNYSMHALAEAVKQLQEKRESYALITTNGGMLSKHASGIYSSKPSTVNWAEVDTAIDSSDLAIKEISEDPKAGMILSYVVYPDKNGRSQAIILGKTDEDKQFVARTSEDDNVTSKLMSQEDPTEKRVEVTKVEDGQLLFRLVDS